MSQAPDWTSSITEWAVLHDQLSQTSEPTLSHSSRLSSAALLGLCSTAALTHLLVLWLRAHNLHPAWGPFERDNGRSLLPNLRILLPILFTIHATLNIGSISSLLTDVDRLKFRGRTNAIQQFNYSLLVCAGILVTWAISSGVPPLRIGASWSSATQHLARLPPGTYTTALGFTALALAFLVPLPWIVLSTIAVEKMNRLDGALLETVNKVLEAGEPSRALTAEALGRIDELEKAANGLYTHVRALAAAQLVMGLLTLAACLWASLAVLGALRKQVVVVHASRHRRTHSSLDTPAPVLLNTRLHPLDPLDEADKLTCKPSMVSVLEELDRPDFKPTTASALQEFERSKPSSVTTEVRLLASYATKIRLYLLLVLGVGLSFAIMNLCILFNAFKYPDRISIGDQMILTLKWSSWAWNGSSSPILAIVMCLVVVKRSKKIRKTRNEQHVWNVVLEHQ